jgi:protein O-GlcNAc transferase
MYTPYETQQLKICGLLQQQGRWGEVAAICQALIEKHPQNADALQILGIYKAQSGQPEAGIALLKQALSTTPEAAHIRNNLANLLSSLGKTEEAIQHYQEALKQNPTLSEAWHNLGNIHRNRQDWAEALRHYQEALKHLPQQVAIRLSLGQMQEKLGQWGEARQAYQQVCRQSPQHWQAWFYLAHLEHQQDQREAAEAFYRQTLKVQPNQPDALYWLGELLLQSHSYTEAIACFEGVLSQNPSHALSHNSLGNAWYRCNQIDRAENHYRQALELEPDFVQVINNLAGTAMARRDYDEALSMAQRAVELSPEYVEAWENLGVIAREMHNLPLVEQAYTEASRLRPRPGLQIRQALLLPALYHSEAEIQNWKTRYSQNLETLLASDLHLSDPDAEVGELPFYLHYMGEVNPDLAQKLAQFYQKSCPALGYTAPHCQDYQWPQQRKIKIGFVSKHLRGHSIGKLMQGVIRELDRNLFEVCVYPLIAPDDALGVAIMESADRARILTPALFPAQAELAEEALDILFYPDIGIESLSYFLAMARLAPLQVLTWGHGTTSGIANLDCFLSSKALETDTSRQAYTEKLLEMESLFPFYGHPPFEQLTKSREDFGLPSNGSLYICPQSLFKLHPQMDSVLAEILEKDPNSHLILIEGIHPQWSALIRDRFAETLPKVLDRILFLPRQNESDFLQLIALCDLNLDTWPLSGGNSTLDTLVTGTPLITLTGDWPAQRLSAAIYSQLGETRCIAQTQTEYIKLALELAHNSSLREELQTKILKALPNIYNYAPAVRELEQILLTELKLQSQNRN